MDSHAGYLSQKRFGSLDGLRALSIVAVIWHHTQPQWFAGTPLAYAGSEGVTLFFAISGFLITTLLLRERQRNGRIDLAAFYVRRSLRIFPLYYTVLLVYVLAVFLFERDTAPGRAFFDNLGYFLTYTSNLFVQLTDRVIFYFSWSLAAEEQFYLLWPPAIFFLGGTRPTLLLLALLLTCILLQVFQSQLLSAVPVAIVAGALLAIGLNKKNVFAVLRVALGWAGASFLLLSILIASLVWLVPPAWVIHLLCVALVGSCVVRERHALSGLLGSKPLVFVGSISYGMYLFHMLCKNFVVKTAPVIHLELDGAWLFVLTLLVSTVVAAVSYRYYESSFLKLKHRFER
jgi:peptidoglycan/LPS O-acetylase OafA/YrhL